MWTLSGLPDIGYGTLSNKVCLGYSKKELENYCRGLIFNFSDDIESIVRYYTKELNLDTEIEGMYFDVLSDSMYMYVENNEIGKIMQTYIKTDNDKVFPKGDLSAFLVKKRMLGVMLYLKEQRDLIGKEEAITYVKQFAPKIVFQDILNKFISSARLRYEKIKTGEWTKIDKKYFKDNINTSIIECYFITRTKSTVYFYRYKFHTLECGAVARRDDDEGCFKQYLNFLYLQSNYFILYTNELKGEEVYLL